MVQWPLATLKRYSSQDKLWFSAVDWMSTMISAKFFLSIHSFLNLQIFTHHHSDCSLASWFLYSVEVLTSSLVLGILYDNNKEWGPPALGNSECTVMEYDIFIIISVIAILFITSLIFKLNILKDGTSIFVGLNMLSTRRKMRDAWSNGMSNSVCCTGGNHLVVWVN